MNVGKQPMSSELKIFPIGYSDKSDIATASKTCFGFIINFNNEIRNGCKLFIFLSIHKI